MEIGIILAVGTLNIACFFIGFKFGARIPKGESEKPKAPTLNPIKAMREHNDKKLAEKEQARINTIMRNIENYDGTANGQEDVPRG